MTIWRFENNFTQFANKGMSSGLSKIKIKSLINNINKMGPKSSRGTPEMSKKSFET